MKHAVHIEFAGDHKPGDPPPSRYLAWHAWAEVQHRAGLRECPACLRWLRAQEVRDERTGEMLNTEGSMVTDDERGPRLVGPHGGVNKEMPNPTEQDLSDAAFNAIWGVTKRWDVNAPEYYVGYCGMNGSHVMVILNALRERGVLVSNP